MSLSTILNTATPGDTPGLARVRQARMDLIRGVPLVGNLAAAFPLREIQTDGDALAFAFDGKTIAFNTAFSAQSPDRIAKQLRAAVELAVADETIPPAMVAAVKQMLRG